MNKAGYVFSLIGGLLAIIFSVLLIVTGPFLSFGSDIKEFIGDNRDDLGQIWLTFGDNNRVDTFLDSDLEDYVGGYVEELQNVDSFDLKELAEENDMEAFEDLSGIYEDVEAYIPSLRLGVIACLIASIVALIGAQVALRFRVAGGVMVLLGAVLTLAFSLVAGSIIPMALASLVLILGGILQIVKKKPRMGETPPVPREEALQ